MLEAPLPNAGGVTIAQSVAHAARQLRTAGIEAPERDARLLVGGATGLTPLDIIARPEMVLDEDKTRRIASLLARRLAREPVSRILGNREFYGREFLVTPATLDPRPETETVIDLALEIAEAEGWRNRSIRILDVGTGSGAILLTLLAELPMATGLGTDIDPAAIETARKNSQRLALDARAEFELRRSLDNIEGPFDLVVSNPPYIPSDEIASLEPEVRDYDPRGALDGGGDGLDVYRDIARGLRHVVRDGWTVLEVGFNQVDPVIELLGTVQLAGLRLKQDLAGAPRCVAVKTQR